MTVFTIFFEADFMKKEDVKSYSITENVHSGLELELQFMPRFFMENPGALTPHIHEFYQIIWFRRGHGCITLIS